MTVLFASLVECNPIVKRETNHLSPLNENDDDSSLIEEEHGDREKRKIGAVKLGISNGIINFVFGKLDSFLDAKTKALGALDESNKAKNAIYGIDNKGSATSEFLGDLFSKKIQASTASIGPLINSATTFVTAKGQGLVGALTSKLAPLSSLSAGASGGSSSGGSGGSGSSPISGILSLITSLSGSSSSSSGANNGDNYDDNKGSSENGTGAGINLGAFANVGGGISTTTEDIPKFDRNKVVLDVPSEAFGTGFTTVTAISKIIGNLILNSAHRTENILEIFKPFFRGAFAIKGLPSDNQKLKRQSKKPNKNI
ncbi:hypothetical protein PV326_004229 [Microctonus aethiopoides]|nr:hypothetical protein PV326_004229 [Microctonus aethiopoides]